MKRSTGYLLSVLTLGAVPCVALSQQAADSASEASFNVQEYRVLGTTLLPPEKIEAAVYPFLGPNKSLADVEGARAALESAYRAAGYAVAYVDIPEQDTADGVVRLNVTEGKIDRVRITGARYFSNGKIRAALPALTPGQSPNLPQIQAQLADLNRETAERSVTPILKAGSSPGSVDIELKVTDSLPVHGSLEVNDRYTDGTAKTRVYASLGYANLFDLNHSFTLQYQTAPENRANLEAIVGTYVLPVTMLEKTSLALYAVDSKTDVAALGTLSVLGNGQIFGSKLIRLLDQGDDYNSNLALGVEYKDFLENIQLDTATSLKTPTRYLNWSLAYNGNAMGEGRSTGFNAGVTWGIRGLVNDPILFAGKRYLGSPNYVVFHAGLQQTLDLPWKFQIGARVNAQYSPDSLVSNEQLGLGGVDTIRGYLDSTQFGDYGANASLELRYTGFAKWLDLPPSAVQLYTFLDGGVVALNNPLPAQRSESTLRSTGVGLRINGWHGLGATLDWARILGTPLVPGLSTSRTHFSIRYVF